ncbi:hypothetical protein DFH29DRAFT_1005244 [Suillus ampliporus]|nr:hypothetical protein DFH29DRAFT_1005244 [Suillus ampliporus]
MPVEIPSSAFISESYFLQCTPIAENHAIVVTVEEEEDEQAGEVLAITRSKAKNTQSTENTPKEVPTQTPTPPPQSTKVIRAETMKAPKFKYESKAAVPNATQHVYRSILDMVVPHLTVSDLLTISPELRKEAVEHCHMHRVPAATTFPPANTFTTSTIPPLQVDHATPLREIRVTLNGTHSELGLLDEGSEIVVIREDVWRKMHAPINQNVRMQMQTANRGSQEMAGCIEMLEIDVEGIKTWAHAYVVPDAPYHLLLGRPWQRLIHLSKAEDTDGIHVSIRDPMNPANT